MQGRGVLITGGSLGIGKAVARACVGAGADVLICARSGDELEKTKMELLAEARAGQRVLAKVADVSDPDSASELVSSAASELENLTGLVNCAGISGPKGLLDEVGVDEWIETIRINLVGTMLVCRAILPHLRRRGYGKIVNLSGGGATSPYPRFSAYAASKAGVVRFTENLAQELEGTNIYVNSVAPGAVNTRMLEQLLEAGPEKVGKAGYERGLKQKAEGGSSPDRAAALCLSLLSPATDGVSGRLISAVWDPWETLPARREEIMKSDVYTLRRILPKDRGLGWE